MKETESKIALKTLAEEMTKEENTFLKKELSFKDYYWKKMKMMIVSFFFLFIIYLVFGAVFPEGTVLGDLGRLLYSETFTLVFFASASLLFFILYYIFKIRS